MTTKAKEIPEVTERNTKTEILAAYNKMKTIIKEDAAVKLDPVKEIQEKKNTETIQRVKEVKPGDLESLLGKIEVEVGKINEKLAVYNNIENAIEIKEKELKELFAIEKEACTLAALLNSQKYAETEFDKRMIEKENALKAKLDELTNVIKEREQEFNENSRKRNEEVKEARKKDEEEWNYSFKRQQIIANDKLKDELDSRKKEFDSYLESERKTLELQKEEVQERESVLDEVKAEIIKLEEKIEGFEQEKAEAVEKAVKEAEDKAKKGYTYEVNLLKKDNEGKVALLENKIETLEDRLKDSETKNSDLARKLDEAYARIETLAAKTVEGASNGKIISTLETALKEKGVVQGK